MLGLTLLCSCFVAAASTLLECQSNFTCPGSPVSCECQGFASVDWTVTSLATVESILFGRIGFTDRNGMGDVLSDNGYTAVLCNITMRPTILTSKLNFAFNISENIKVECFDNLGPDTALLQRASSPSLPVNLRSTLTSTATDSVAVRLDWDPPLNDGGVAITNYLIVVNMSQEINSGNTNAIITLNSIGQHLIEISAVNDCGIMSDNASITINITVADLNTLPTSAITSEESAGTATMDTTTLSSTATTTNTTDIAGGEQSGSNPSTVVGIGAGVGGGAIVVLLIVICIVVGALLIRARKSKGTTKLNGQEEAGGYSQFNFNKAPKTGQEEAGGYSKFNFNMAPQTGGNGASAVDPKIIQEEYSVIGRQNGPRPEARGEAQLNPSAPVQSQYSVLEQKNGAEPEMIPDYDYCSVGAKPKKQPAKKTETSVQYIEVEISTERFNRQRELMKPASDDIQYTVVKVKTHPADGLLNLDSLLLQLRVVQSKWDQIGKALNLTEDRIQHIKKTTSGEEYDCLVEVCDEWLRSLLNHDMNPTWRVVANALNRIGCKELSKEIKGIYKTGKLPRSPSDEDVAAPATGDAADSNYDDIVVTGGARNRQAAAAADLPQYDDIITSTGAPPPIPPQRFDISESATMN